MMEEEEPWLILQRATNEKRWPWNKGRRMDQDDAEELAKLKEVMTPENVYFLHMSILQGAARLKSIEDAVFLDRLLADCEIE